MRRSTLVFLLFFTTAVAAADAGRQHIRLRILHENTPKAGVTVRLTFPDGEHTNGTSLTLVTDQAGFVEARIPSTVFWVTVPEENPDVVGKEFRFAKIEKTTKVWQLRPRDWNNDDGENRQ